MAATPEDVWKIGDVLLFNSPLAIIPEEMRARQTAARAYYAAFHLLLDSLRVRQNRPDYQVGHSALSQWFRTAKSKELQLIGELIEDARVLRVDCDYHLDQTVGKQQVSTLRAELQREIISQRAKIVVWVANEQNPPPVHRTGMGET